MTRPASGVHNDLQLKWRRPQNRQHFLLLQLFRNATRKNVQPPRLFLIDTYGFIFRAYHARARTGAPPMRTSTGLSTEVVFIFSNMLRKLTRTYEPAYMAAVFESLGKTDRETEYAEYK